MATYTWDSSEDNESTITRALTESNDATCDLLGVPRGSTQGQVDAFIAAAQAENPPRLVGVTASIFNTNQSWVRSAIKEEIKRTRRAHKAADTRTYEQALLNATRNQKDQIAVVLGLASDMLD